MDTQVRSSVIYPVTCVHTAAHCNTLQHTAAHCNTLIYPVTCVYIYVYGVTYSCVWHDSLICVP